jgi:single-stranded DNA-binding protein
MSNQITVSGKCWEPKTQYTPNGMCITEFSVSVYDGKDKTTQKSKYFNVNCKAFKDLAENIANSINSINC